MGKALSGELSCPCDKSCFFFLSDGKGAVRGAILYVGGSCSWNFHNVFALIYQGNFMSLGILECSLSTNVKQ